MATAKTADNVKESAAGKTGEHALSEAGKTDKGLPLEPGTKGDLPPPDLIIKPPGVFDPRPTTLPGTGTTANPDDRIAALEHDLDALKAELLFLKNTFGWPTSPIEIDPLAGLDEDRPTATPVPASEMAKEPA